MNQAVEKFKKNDKKKAGEVFGKIGQAEVYISKHPIYYDEKGFFWVWSFERYCYEKKDETTLLNGIRKEMRVDTINGKERVEIIAALKQIGREQEPKEKPKGWIQFQDILVDAKTLKQTPATHEYFLTNPIPWKLGESEETPITDRLLREWVVKEGVQDESHVQSLYEYIAYALTDDLFMQRIIALTGGGSNGKGTFLKLIEKLVGTENRVSVDLRKLSTNTFATSCLHKKLVAFAGEVGYRDLTNTNVLKLLVGEDSIVYEFKGKGAFTEENITTFYIATNSLPITPDKSLGFYRRWVITDFPNIFNIKANIISIVPDKEYENLCLKSLNILNGLYKSRKFTNEGTYEEREKRYEGRAEPVPNFIEENCEEVTGEKISLREFGKKLNEWLRAKSLRVMTIIWIGKELRKLGYITGAREFYDKQSGETTSGIVVLGLKFKNKATQTTRTTVGITQEPYEFLIETSSSSSSTSSFSLNLDKNNSSSTQELTEVEQLFADEVDKQGSL